MKYALYSNYYWYGIIDSRCTVISDYAAVFVVVLSNPLLS